jgi:hypothetical protein
MLYRRTNCNQHARVVLCCVPLTCVVVVQLQHFQPSWPEEFAIQCHVAKCRKPLSQLAAWPAWGPATSARTCASPG